MCGINGWVSPAGRVDETQLIHMRDVLVHRGPDGCGHWMDDERRVGLAHRRLSIIDLSAAANQPMLSANGNEIVVFNGEIYNHRELRAELERAGCEFRTNHSDTEVLLVGYRHWGLENMLERLNGMFAFALHDRRADRLFLVRDRIGIKPLYWAQTGDDLLFASEIKALLVHPSVEPQLEQANLRYHMAFRSLPAPRTLFENVCKLERAHYLSIDTRSGQTDIVEYWDPLNQAQASFSSSHEAGEELLRLLSSAVDYRLEADVPVGLLLSGGLDSTVVLELAAKRISGLSTYTATYPGFDSYNETSVAETSAARHETRHHNVEIDESSYLSSLARVAYHQDEPIAAPVCLPVFLLAKRAHDTGVPVILAGEGSDELFIGYQNWIRVRDMQRGVNAATKLAGRPVTNNLLGFLGGLASDWSRPGELLRRAGGGFPMFWGGAMEFHQPLLRRLFQGTAMEFALDDTFQQIVLPIWQRYSEARGPADIAGWMAYIDLNFRLPELMLPRLDKMGMAFSTEGRVPFLDHRIAEFVFSLPMQLRGASGSQPKKLLRDAVENLVPPSINSAAKRGFQAPVKEWKFGPQMRRYLDCLPVFASRTNLFNATAVHQLLAQRDDRLYFGMLNFMLWYCIFVDNVVEDIIGDLKISSEPSAAG